MKLLNALKALLDKFRGGENVVHYLCGSEALPLPLSGEEEAELLTKLDAGDDTEAVKASLIEHNLRLVVYISRKFENTGVDADDLISIGTIGLIKAINSFRTDNNI
ncbi:MAG: RNA polymerase sporulation sigma factor SigE, partial [Clostridia bacterium]|nr:RNA polymerase sporulation sigma factor SigE [Clostridia bacterium]